MNSSANLLNKFFDILVTLSIALESLTTNIFEGFTNLEFVLMGGGVCVICTLILSLTLYIRYRKPMYIRNAMVLSIGIGEYETNHSNNRMDFTLCDLSNAIRIDMENVTHFCGGNLNYDVFPRYDDDGGLACRVNWNKTDLITFLKRMAMNLQQNLLNENIPSYDGLIVFFSCHGLKDAIYTSDYQTMTRESIHRIFSSFAINRTIPRIFIFDCCAGNQSGDIQSDGKGDSQHNDPVMKTHDEENVDFKLVQIDGANPDYTAGANLEYGSFLTRILIRALKEKPRNFLFENMMSVQNELYDRRSQLTKQCYFNGTEYIKFKANKHDNNISNHHEAANLMRSMTQSIIIETEEKELETELSVLPRTNDDTEFVSESGPVLDYNAGSVHDQSVKPVLDP